MTVKDKGKKDQRHASYITDTVSSLLCACLSTSILSFHLPD